MTVFSPKIVAQHRKAVERDARNEAREIVIHQSMIAHQTALLPGYVERLVRTAIRRATRAYKRGGEAVAEIYFKQSRFYLLGSVDDNNPTFRKAMEEVRGKYPHADISISTVNRGGRPKTVRFLDVTLSTPT